MKRSVVLGFVVLAACGGADSETPSKADVAVCRAMDSLAAAAKSIQVDRQVSDGERSSLEDALDRLRDRADLADDPQLAEWGAKASDIVRAAFVSGTAGDYKEGVLDGFEEACDAIGAPFG